jgi:hypothetical protein
MKRIRQKTLDYLPSAEKVLFRTGLVCVLIAATLAGLSLRRIERLPLTSAPLQFEASRAYKQMKTLAQSFPYRLPWHENRGKAREWIKSELKRSGYTPQEMVFSAVIAGQQYTDLTNVYVERRGRSKPDEIILAVAHYDTTDTTIEGAADDASGTAVVLELARVFSQVDPERTLIFLLTDSEEFGAFWGARTFARTFDRAQQIIAVANFDFVAPEEQKAILTLTDGMNKGFTPLWLRELALDSLRSLGTVEVLDFTHFMEFIERALLVPAADHGVFLEQGIPAFNWVGQTSDFIDMMTRYHHTPLDRASAMREESFKPFGLAAERLIRTIDALPKVPQDFRDSSYFKVTDRLYIDGWVMLVLKLLCFVPFIVYSVVRFTRTLATTERSLFIRVVRNELKNLGILLGSFLFGYLVIRLLPALKVITQYETFPATQKSEILYNPNIWAILLVLVTVAIVYFAMRRVFSEKVDDLGALHVRHSVQTIALALTIVVAFFGNSYLATLLLLPPAYFWTLLHRGRGRWINFLLILGGTLSLLILGIIVTRVFHLGIVYWYVFLATAYGLISAYTAVVFFILMAMLIRALRHFVFLGRTRKTKAK